MAEQGFTDYLPVETRGKPIVPTSEPRQDPLNAAFAGGGGFIDAMHERQQQNIQAQRFKEEQTEFGEKQSDRAAENYVTTQLNNPDRFMPGGMDHPDLSFLDPNTVPPQLKQQADQAAQMRSAVAQGRVPQATFDIAVKNIMSDVERMYPASSGAAYKYLHELGFVDPKIQQSILTNEIAKQQAMDQVKNTEIAKEEYVRAGGDPTADENTQISHGSQLLAAKYQLDLVTRNMALARDKVEMEKLGADAQEAQNNLNDRQISSSVGAYTDKVLQPLMDRLTNYVAGITDPKELDALEQGGLMTQGVNSINQIYARAEDRARSMGGGQKAVDDLESARKARIETFTTIWDTNYKSNAQAMQNYATRMGLSADQAAPHYAFLKSMFGPQEAFAIANGTAGQLSQDLAKFPAEVKSLNYDYVNSDPGGFRLTAMQYHDYATGKLTPDQMDVKTAQKQIQVNTLMAPVNAKAVVGGDMTATPNFLKNVELIAYGTNSITPGSQDLRSAQAASDALFNPINRHALILATKDPTNGYEAGQTVTRVRSAASHLLQTAQAMNASDPNGVVEIKLAADGSHFEFVGNRQGYAKYVQDHSNAATQQQLATSTGAPSGAVGSNPLSYNEALRNITPAMREKVDIMNKALRLLSDTDLAKADPYMHIKGAITPLDLAQHYGQGKPLPGGSTDKQDTDVAADRAKEANAISEQFKALPLQVENDPNLQPSLGGEKVLGPIEDAKADKYGVPRKLARAVFGIESTHGENNVLPPDMVGKSHAAGAGATQPDIARKYGQKVEGNGVYEGKLDERISNPEGNIDASMHYMHDIAYGISKGQRPTKEQWREAYVKHYNGGNLNHEQLAKIDEALADYD